MGRVGSTLTPEAKMAGFPLSSMSSSSSLVVVRPAASRGHNECSPTQGVQEQPCSAPQSWPHLSALAPPPPLTDLQLPLYPAFAPLPVVTLCRIVLRHDFHKLPGQRGVLGVRDRGTGVRPSPTWPKSLRGQLPTQEVQPPPVSSGSSGQQMSGSGLPPARCSARCLEEQMAAEP